MISCRRTALTRTLAVILIASLGTRAHAQSRSAVAVGTPVASSGFRIERHAIAVTDGDSWRTSDFWKWTGVGALVGAAGVVGWAAVRAGHSDAVGVSPAAGIVILGGVGAVGGGLAGALTYALAHPMPATSP